MSYLYSIGSENTIPELPQSSVQPALRGQPTGCNPVSHAVSAEPPREYEITQRPLQDHSGSVRTSVASPAGLVSIRRCQVLPSPISARLVRSLKISRRRSPSSSCATWQRPCAFTVTVWALI